MYLRRGLCNCATCMTSATAFLQGGRQFCLDCFIAHCPDSKTGCLGKKKKKSVYVPVEVSKEKYYPAMKPGESTTETKPEEKPESKPEAKPETEPEAKIDDPTKTASDEYDGYFF